MNYSKKTSPVLGQNSVNLARSLLQRFSNAFYVLFLKSSSVIFHYVFNENLCDKTNLNKNYKVSMTFIFLFSL